MSPEPSENPAGAAAPTGPRSVVYLGGERTPGTTSRPNLQDNSRGARHLRLVHAPPPPRPRPRRRLAVRINVLDGRAPYGRSRAFDLSESDVQLLIAAAIRLEARRA
jgi:hypothetical protein